MAKKQLKKIKKRIKNMNEDDFYNDHLAAQGKNPEVLIKIPNKIKILSKTYDVKFVDDNYFCGHDNLSKCKLIFQEGIDDIDQLITLFQMIITIIEKELLLKLNKTAQMIIAQFIINIFKNGLKLSDKITVLNRTYNVEYRNNNSDSGNAIYNTKQIIIDKNNDLQHKHETLIHEIIHLISDTFYLELDENTVHMLGIGLYTFFADNGFIIYK
jgi:hypothetical protein